MDNRYEVIYTRQSVLKLDSISIESQIDFCSRECTDKNPKVYQDEGYSGKNTNRPDFQHMLEEIRKGAIKKVVVYRLDRISRSILDFANMIEIFSKYQVEFVSCSEKFDTSTPMGRAMLSICVVFAQLERESIQQRVIDNYITRSEKGFYMGGRVPYGYKLIPTVLDSVKTSMYEISEPEAEHIRLIYNLYAEPAVSYGDILAYFQKHNIVKTDGKPWGRTRIADFLKNPIYVKADQSIYDFYTNQGTIVINPPSDFAGTNGCYYFWGDKSVRKQAELKGQKLVIAPHEGIIDSDIWLKCRIKCLHNKQIQPARKAFNTWLASLVKCGKCGYALTFKKYNTRRSRYLLCSNKMNSKACEGAGTLYADEFENMIFQEMIEKLQEFSKLAAIQSNQKETAKEIAIRAELSDMEKEINTLIDRLASANNIVMDYINQRVLILDSKKKALERELASQAIESIDTSKVLEMSKCLEKWEDLTVKDKNQVATSIIKVIHATSEKTEITWKI